MDEDQGIIAPADEKGNDHKLPWECVGTCMYIGYLTYLISLSPLTPAPSYALSILSGRGCDRGIQKRTARTRFFRAIPWICSMPERAEIPKSLELCNQRYSTLFFPSFSFFAVV